MDIFSNFRTFNKKRLQILSGDVGGGTVEIKYMNYTDVTWA